MANDALVELIQATVALTLALVLLLALRRPLRRWLGAKAAYASWSLAPLAVLAVLLPARSPDPGIVATADVVSLAVALPAAAPATGSMAQAWLFVWLLGAAALALLMLVRQRRFHAGVEPRPGLDYDACRWTTPAVTGLFRPRIVLPFDFATRYTPSEQRLVIAHERLHIERGDIPAQALASLIRCAFWFHPLVHVAVGRFRLDQELACDAAVVARFPASRRSYGDAMLKTQLADFGLPAGCHWQSCHPLKERLQMLNRPLPGALRNHVGKLFVVLLVAGASFAAWASQAPPVVDAEEASAPTFRKMSPPVYPADAIARGISGRVDVEVLVASDGTAKEVEVKSSHPAGVFDEAALEAVRNWTFNPGLDPGTGKPVETRIEVPIQFDAKDEPAINVDAAPQTTLTDEDLLAPPAYPAEAAASGLAGLVVLDVLVGADGVPTEVKIFKSSGDGLFDEPAVQAAWNWRFNAGRNGARGEKVEGWVRVPVNFSPEQPGKADAAG